MNHKIRPLTAISLLTAFLILSSSFCFAGEILKTGKVLYSQCSEELVIRDFFNDKRGGFFVDVGCSHYKDLSTTYYLEEKLGWKGIGIDALDEYAEDYKHFRPNTIFCNYIVADKSGGTMEIYVNFQQKSLSSIVYKPEPFTHGETVQVPKISLNDLLKKYHVKKIDFLSVDVEGAEPMVLAGFNIKKYRPELVCIEANKGTDIQKSIMDYFKKNDYEIIREYSTLDVGQNWYFRPKKR